MNPDTDAPPIKAKPCRHSYDGDFDKGWTCTKCGDYQKEVAYYETADAQRCLARQKETEKRLRQEIDDLMLSEFRTGYEAAIATLVENETAGVGNAIKLLRECLAQLPKPSKG